MQIMSIDFPLDTEHLPRLLSTLKVPQAGPSALFLENLAAKKLLSFTMLRNLAILMSGQENSSKYLLIVSEDKKQCISNISDVIHVATEIIPSNLEIQDQHIVTYVENLRLGAEEYLRKLRVMPLVTIKEGLGRMEINSVEIRNNLYLEMKAIDREERDYFSPGKRKGDEGNGMGSRVVGTVEEEEEGDKEIGNTEEDLRGEAEEKEVSDIEKRIDSEEKKIESKDEADGKEEKIIESYGISIEIHEKQTEDHANPIESDEGHIEHDIKPSECQEKLIEHEIESSQHHDKHSEFENKPNEHEKKLSETQEALIESEINPIESEKIDQEPEDKRFDSEEKKDQPEEVKADRIEENTLDLPSTQLLSNDKIQDSDLSSSILLDDSLLKVSVSDSVNQSTESPIKYDEKDIFSISDSSEKTELKKSVSLKKESKIQPPHSKTEIDTGASNLPRLKESKLLTEKASKIGKNIETAQNIEKKEPEDRREIELKVATSPITSPTHRSLKQPTALDHEIKSPPASEESKLTRAATLKYQRIKEVPFNKTREPLRSGTFEEKEAGTSEKPIDDESGSKSATLEDAQKAQAKKESRITKIKH